MAHNEQRECYVGMQLYYKNIDINQIEDVNRNNYITGMSRDVYNFIYKLEEIFQKKQAQLLEDNNDPDMKVYTKDELFDKKSKYPIEKSSDTFLSTCPGYKNKYLVDFAKNYINRDIINKDNDPSIIKINLDDKDYKISVVEMNISMKVLLLGYMSGKIKIVFLYEDSKYDLDPSDIENKEKVNLFSENMPFNSDSKLINFGINSKTYDLKGHSQAITCLSLSYDSFCFLSGSGDAEIRLWNVRSGLCLAIFSMHISSISDVCFCPKGFFFASGGMDKQVLELLKIRFIYGQLIKDQL